VAVDGSGAVYIADSGNNQVLKETPSGSSYTQSTPITGLNQPYGLAVDSSGAVYVADSGTSQVLKETPSGSTYTASTVAGGLNQPFGVAVDGSGAVYVADTLNNQVLKETPSGGGYTAGTVASGLNQPFGVAVDGNGAVYVADSGNNQVLKETPSGGGYITSTVASGLGSPEGVAVDSSGAVYIADTFNNQVLKETPSGGSYTQSTLVTGLHFPEALDLDRSGNLYVLDRQVVQEFLLGGTTTLTYSGATTGNYHDAATLAATLADAAGNPLATQPVTFTLDGSETCAATSDSSGHAACAVTPLEATGSYSATASFAGDATHAPISTTVPFTVTPEETTLAFTGTTLATVPIANTGPATVSAVLKEDGSTAPAPAGQPVTLTLGSGGNAQSCQGQTGANGAVSCQIASVNQPLGNQPVSAIFAGDSHYAASSASGQQLLVFSYVPSGGAFALGDQTAAHATPGTTVTWWGAQWTKQNSLSGGAAPTSFKGFAQKFSSGTTTVTNPVCGGTWTTSTGNSPTPPSSVPAYMAVVVPNKVTQSGSTVFSGNITKIVIVKTNPGYQPDPSHPGTGTVVATLCGS
jgi:DNA-binding beta-propeller fold protein YncE